MRPAPTVTVLTPTYNRPHYLPDALRSVIGQTFRDWELLVINDGGQDVRTIVEGLGDPRIVYFNRTENRGKAACLNLALQHARGHYIAYLDDDDIWYPSHLACLLEALRQNPQMAVAYSDLYEVLFVKDEHGTRHPLQKRVKVSRDYNRMFMFHTNHVLHVSLMHTKELALRAGGYDENVRVMIDWDITRKLSFFVDFLHVPSITGEYYISATESDRISDMQRLDDENFKQNLRRIRADLPPQPWPKVKRVAVVFPVKKWDDQELSVVRYLVDKLDYPCCIVLVNRDASRGESDCRCALGRLAELKNLQVIPSPPCANVGEAYLAGASSAGADYYYFPSAALSLAVERRLIQGLCYMTAAGCDAVRWEADRETAGDYDLMLSRDLLPCAGAPLSGAAEGAHTVPEDWLPDAVRTDYLLHYAAQHQAEGDYASAERFLQEASSIIKGGVGSTYLAQLRSEVAFSRGNYERAENVCRQLIAEGLGADNWVRLGQILQRRGDYEGAAHAYRKGLEAIGLSEAGLESSVFPVTSPLDFDAFTAVVGLGECCLKLGQDDEAARCLRRAARLRLNNFRPYLGFARLFLKHGELQKAEEALFFAQSLDPDGDAGAIEAAFAELHERRGEGEKAWGCCLKALAATPQEAAYLRQAARLGRCPERMGDLLDAYERFLSYRPGDVSAMVELAELCQECGRVEQALQLAQRAAVFSPQDARVRAILDRQAGCAGAGQSQPVKRAT